MRVMILNLLATMHHSATVSDVGDRFPLSQVSLAYLKKLMCLVIPVVAIYCATLGFAWQSYPDIYLENGLMENLQAVALGMACLVMLLCQLRQPATSTRFVSWCYFLVFLAMLLREVDAETLSLSALIEALISGTGRNTALGIAFGGTAIYAMTRPQTVIKQTFTALRVNGPWLFAGCALYLASWPFDKGMFPIPEHMTLFLEEAVECAATLCFLVASIEHYFAGRQRIRLGSQPQAEIEAKKAA